MYGERLERVVLFGSYARGDAGPDSDYDVAIFAKGMDGCYRPLGRARQISRLATRPAVKVISVGESYRCTKSSGPLSQ